MKIYLTKLLFLNASELAAQALEAHRQGLVEKEIRLGIAAHLMAFSSLEAAINEIGENGLEKPLWDCAEKLDTLAKWVIFPRLAGGAQFDPGKEPLQTIEHLKPVRNAIAHPKGRQGSDVILGHKDGRLQRDALPETTLADGDRVYLGGGKLLDEFNADTAQDLVNRTCNALRQLRIATSYEGMDWLDGTLDYDF
jgi:hypothetical protein